MKLPLHLFLHASAASLLVSSGLAQNAVNPKADRPPYSGEPLPSARRLDRLNDAAKASDLIGMAVKNYQGEKLGKVEELAVDLESGRIVQVILSTGGFIGIGDTLTAVPPGVLHRDITNKVLHLDANREKLKGAPPFEMSRWTEGGDTNHLSAVYHYYGDDSTLRFINHGTVVPEGQRGTEASANTAITRKADGTWDRDSSAGSREGRSMIPVARLGQAQKASKLVGYSVKNLQDQTLGKVENLLVDLPSGRVVAVIVSSGGFLGMGDELSAVPPMALRFSPDRETLQLDASKDMLSSAPHFKADQWPDFAEPNYAYGVYRAYQVEPYFTTNLNSAPDNTVRNRRDRDNRTLTPLDQGNSPGDLATTAQIRKEIIAGKDMSVNGKNVKIITNDGQVTLRGPVNTAEEKRLIGDIAINIARLENVDNQLEVK